ncbi:MAG TPA: XRE family transcriptional regulator [Ktedonobacteraceae bacterium]|jgi:transcriptional regulator with XRE-family HTH domain
MSGHKNFRGLRQRLQANPEYTRLLEEQRATQERELAETLQALTTLRKARGVTQEDMAEAWDTTQSNVSRFEHAQDTYLSTLMRYIAALGGQLKLYALFPDEGVDGVVDLTPGSEGFPRRAMERGRGGQVVRDGNAAIQHQGKEDDAGSS